jgi:hypothetical protein
MYEFDNVFDSNDIYTNIAPSGIAATSIKYYHERKP